MPCLGDCKARPGMARPSVPHTHATLPGVLATPLGAEGCGAFWSGQQVAVPPCS